MWAIWVRRFFQHFPSVVSVFKKQGVLQQNQVGTVRVVGESTSGHEQGGVGDGISGCAGEKGPLFGRSARAGAAGAT